MALAGRMDRLIATMGLLGKMTKEQIIGLRLLFLISCVFYMVKTTEATTSNVMTYLNKFGYLEQESGDQVHDDAQLEEAIRALQVQCNIDVTGIGDENVLECISRARCGNTDHPSTRRRRSGRKRRYSIPTEGLDWSPTSTHLTYDIVRYTDDLPPTVVEEAVGDAFELWSNSTTLTFQRIRGGDVDIGIYFYPSFEEHGDNRPFDGPGMVLAHAFWPWSEENTAEVHLDEGETWTDKSYSGANIWLVVGHEIGHSLGLGHSVAFGSLMFPFHFGYNPHYTLHQDDIDGIQSLYGDIETPSPVAADAPDLCHVTMDAVLMDGHTYIFKSDYYWRVSNGKQENGYPQRISSRWTGLEGDIDAAITVKNGYVWGDDVQKTFFFKGRLVWRYTLTILDIGFPKDISEAFPGFPAGVVRIKGVFEISGNGETYFFTDGGFYLLNWLDVQGPYGINVFGGIPTNIVGAMQWTDNYIYFFTDDFLYFQCSPWSFSTSRGYPRNARDWTGCPAA